MAYGSVGEVKKQPNFSFNKNKNEECRERVCREEEGI